MDERTQKFIAYLPIPQRVSVKKAAEILDDEDAAQELLNLVANGHLFSWTHCPVSGDAHIHINNSLGISSEKQPVTPDTEPAKVFIEGGDVRWRWCVSYEATLQCVDHPSKSTVEARELIVLTQARTLPAKTDTAPVEHANALETDKGGSAGNGLLTKEIANIFNGVNGWKADRWPKILSASKWLHPARIALGGAGTASSVWNPLTLAQLMHSKTKGARAKERLMNILNSRFTHNSALAPWRGDFNEYFAIHCRSD